MGLVFEQRMGSLRFGAVALVGHLCGTAAVVLLAVAVEDMTPSWTEALAEGDYLGPTAPACAVLAAGSIWMSARWRRRIRTGLLAVLVTLVLYAGYVADAVRLVAALAGLLLGPRLAVRAILEAAGGSNLAWIATWPDNEYWFSPSGRSVVAYRVHASVALTRGNPVGPEEEHGEPVDGFADFCTHVGWIPCFYSAIGTVHAHTAQRGWGHLQVAEETVVPLKALSFTGKKFQDVRTSLNRAEREGIRAQWYRYRSAPLAITEQIRAIGEDWVAERNLPEMGFTLGGLAELADPQVRLLASVDSQERVHGVVSWLPVGVRG